MTNTLSVPAASEAVISYTLQNKENWDVRSVNPVIGETNDGWLNDIRGEIFNDSSLVDSSIASLKRLQEIEGQEQAARRDALIEAANIPFMMSARPEFGLEFHDKMLLQARDRILEIITKEQQ